MRALAATGIIEYHPETQICGQHDGKINLFGLDWITGVYSNDEALDLATALSNRQRKELLVRGREIRIAIPAPPDSQSWTPGEALKFARAVLVGLESATVTSARRGEIRVVPGGGDEGGLTSLLGAMRPIDADEWTIGVTVIDATLSPQSARGTQMPLQWPHSVSWRGEVLR